MSFFNNSIIPFCQSCTLYILSKRPEQWEEGRFMDNNNNTNNNKYWNPKQHPWDFYWCRINPYCKLHLLGALPPKAAAPPTIYRFKAEENHQQHSIVHKLPIANTLPKASAWKMRCNKTDKIPRRYLGHLYFFFLFKATSLKWSNKCEWNKCAEHPLEVHIPTFCCVKTSDFNWQYKNLDFFSNLQWELFIYLYLIMKGR